jgi:hypothetical protein
VARVLGDRLVIARVIAVVAGVWLMFAPAVLDYGDPARSSDRIAGPIAAAFAFVAIWEVLRPLRWATVPVGVWLVVAPVILWSPPRAAVASAAAGVVLIVTAWFGGEVGHRFGGGWTTVMPGGDRWRSAEVIGDG